MGAAIFGVGWGLSGLCPGPAIVLLSTAQLKAFLFLGAVATGIWGAALIQAKTPKAPEAQPRNRPRQSSEQAARKSDRVHGTKSPAKAGLSYSAAAEHGMPGCISGIPKSLHLLFVQPH